MSLTRELLIEHIRQRVNWKHGDVTRLAQEQGWNYQRMYKLVRRHRRYEPKRMPAVYIAQDASQGVRDYALYERVVEEWRSLGIM